MSSLDIFFYNIRNLFKATKRIVMNTQKSTLLVSFILSCYLNKYEQKPEWIF